MTSELYKQIGQLKVEVDWLKKIDDASVEEKREMIEPTLKEIPITRQCALFGIAAVVILLHAPKG